MAGFFRLLKRMRQSQFLYTYNHVLYLKFSGKVLFVLLGNILIYSFERLLAPNNSVVFHWAHINFSTISNSYHVQAQQKVLFLVHVHGSSLKKGLFGSDS